MDKITKKMISYAYEALDNAYAPYSKFKVASCIRSESDSLYTGVNVENGSYGLTTCAEASAICAMICAGERTIKTMVVLAKTNLICSPCGSCRQRIHEFSTSQTIIYLCNKDSILHTTTIAELLPFAFSFKPPMDH